MSSIKTKITKAEDHVSCDLCGKSKYTNFLNNITAWDHQGKFNLVKCTNCSLVYLNPRPSLSKIGKYYSTEVYWEWNKNGEDLKLRNIKFGDLYKIIFNKKSKGKILDIGTGDGLFLTKFKEQGWKVIGTELSKYASKNTSKKYNIEVKTGDFLKIKFKSSEFDVITLNHVLEHLYSPKKTLLKIKYNLKKRGMLVITIPNIDSLGFRIFNKNWHALQPPRHLYHFSPKTIVELLNATGFEVDGFNFNYKSHILYSLFETFRFSFSPKFKKTRNGGLFDSKYQWTGLQNIIIREIGKVVALIFAYCTYFLEVFFQKSDVFTIYATKK